jgi:23S rRNA (uracil1939-C5)-methyltransferase
VTFTEHVRREAERRGIALPPASHAEPLAGLEYADEIAIKEGALAAFWRESALPAGLDPIRPAPQPRGYRTTTKRRASITRQGLALAFPGMPSAAGVAPSRLDRPEHAAVYQAVLGQLARPPVHALAEVLNWVIVRGTAPRMAVLLNVRLFDGDVIRSGKKIAEGLRAAEVGVAAARLYLDTTGSDYYLEARRPAGVLSEKHLFGPEWLEVRVDDLKLRFPPTAFSQVNEPMLATMVEVARDLAGPLDGRDLIDLYCGYGLFSLTLGRAAAHVVGTDHDGPAIEAAQGNAAHARGVRARFIAGRITAEFLASRLPAPRRGEVVLLDPPRQGTEAGVIETLAARRPERVVHVCCGTDEIPREVAAWKEAGYRLERAVPLDLFAGTANLETLLRLVP